MDRTIKLHLRQENGNYKDYIIDFVPYKKRHDYIRLEKELEAREEPPSDLDYEEMRAEFVAGLFNNKEVTAEKILNGLDSMDKDVLYDIVRYRVLGFKKEEDEKIKKALMEAELAGLDSMTSNSTSSEQSLPTSQE